MEFSLIHTHNLQVMHPTAHITLTEYKQHTPYYPAKWALAQITRSAMCNAPGAVSIVQAHEQPKNSSIFLKKDYR